MKGRAFVDVVDSRMCEGHAVGEGRAGTPKTRQRGITARPKILPIGDDDFARHIGGRFERAGQRGAQPIERGAARVFDDVRGEIGKRVAARVVGQQAGLVHVLQPRSARMVAGYVSAVILAAIKTGPG